MSDVLKFIVEDFKRASKELRNTESKLTEYKTKMASAAVAMANNWNGNASEKFDSFAQTHAKELSSIKDSFGELAGFIEEACKYNEDLERHITSAIKAVGRNVQER